MPATSPLLTIGTPTYRRPSHIRARIDEVSRIIPGGVELLVVDNCSRDETSSILEVAARDHPWLTYHLNASNLGCDANYLRVFELARGTYCWLLGDDEAVDWRELPNLLERLRDETSGAVHLVPARARLTEAHTRRFASLPSFLSGFYSLVEFQGLSTVIVKSDLARAHLRAGYTATGLLHAYSRVVVNLLAAGHGLVIYDLPLLLPPSGSGRVRWRILAGYLGAWRTLRESVDPSLRNIVDRREAAERASAIARAAAADLLGFGAGELGPDEIRQILHLFPVRYYPLLWRLIPARATWLAPALAGRLLEVAIRTCRGAETPQQFSDSAATPGSRSLAQSFADAIRARSAGRRVPLDAY